MMKINTELSDQAVLLEIGQRISQQRLSRNLTQAALAKEAGIAKRTLERVEAGESAQLLTIVRILRVLGMLASLDQLIPVTEPGPMQMLRGKNKQRVRASTTAQARKNTPWQWQEDQ